MCLYRCLSVFVWILLPVIELFGERGLLLFREVRRWKAGQFSLSTLLGIVTTAAVSLRILLALETDALALALFGPLVLLSVGAAVATISLAMVDFFDDTNAAMVLHTRRRSEQTEEKPQRRLTP